MSPLGVLELYKQIHWTQFMNTVSKNEAWLITFMEMHLPWPDEFTTILHYECSSFLCLLASERYTLCLLNALFPFHDLTDQNHFWSERLETGVNWGMEIDWNLTFRAEIHACDQLIKAKKRAGVPQWDQHACLLQEKCNTFSSQINKAFSISNVWPFRWPDSTRGHSFPKLSSNSSFLNPSSHFCLSVIERNVFGYPIILVML